jgi:hypothetical protein
MEQSQAQSQYPDLDEVRRFPWLGQNHPGRAITGDELAGFDIGSAQMSHGQTEDYDGGITEEDNPTCTAPNLSRRGNQESETEYLPDLDLRTSS